MDLARQRQDQAHGEFRHRVGRIAGHPRDSQAEATSSLEVDLVEPDRSGDQPPTFPAGEHFKGGGIGLVINGDANLSPEALSTALPGR